jgi:CcmD family protein
MLLLNTVTVSADTLSQAYSDKWEGAAGQESSLFIQFMGSNDLIFVVLAVSLIIWLVLAFYLVRVDKKITSLEKKLSDNEKNLTKS